MRLLDILARQAADVFERTRAGQAPRESEARFRRMFTNNMVPLFIWTPAGDTTDANEAFLDRIGYTRDDLEAGQCRWHRLTPPELRERDLQVVDVTDQGIGIPQDAQARLFDAFYRASNVGAQASGFGLGLHIVREIVQRHGGRIEIDSTEGVGSTFRVVLPAQDASPERRG